MDTGTTKACPFCAETIQAAAIVCRYCGRDLPAAPAPQVAQLVPNGKGGYTCSVCSGGNRSDATICKYCNNVFGAVASYPAPAGGVPLPAPPPIAARPFARAATRLATPTGPQCSVCGKGVGPGAARCAHCGAVFENATVIPAASPPARRISPLAFGGLVIVLLLLCVVAFNLGGKPSSGPYQPDATGAWVDCKDFVSQQLKAPSTAVFPLSNDPGVAIVHLGNSHWVVSGFVDAQNSFGAQLRQTFGCELSYSGTTVRAEHLNIGDQVIR